MRYVHNFDNMRQNISARATGDYDTEPTNTYKCNSKLLPLLLLIVVVAGAAYIGYHVYLALQQISFTATKKLQAKNVVVTKDGIKVGVKEVKNENYVDSTQDFLVKAWNLSSWPGYKSRLWNKQVPAATDQHGGSERRKS